MSDCFARYARSHRYTDAYGDSARSWAAQECERAARNLAFGLACVACVHVGLELWRSEFPIAALRRAGLWRERGAT